MFDSLQRGSWNHSQDLHKVHSPPSDGSWRRWMGSDRWDKIKTTSSRTPFELLTAKARLRYILSHSSRHHHTNRERPPSGHESWQLLFELHHRISIAGAQKLTRPQKQMQPPRFQPTWSCHTSQFVDLQLEEEKKYTFHKLHTRYVPLSSRLLGSTAVGSR